MRPTIRQLEYLIALEEEKSFCRAAEICNVTQSTLSAGIKELENILEQNLVNRTRKNIALTPFGLEVTHQGRKILQETDRIMARARQIKAPLTGTLRLGIIPTIAPYFLPTILPILHKKFPALELQIHEDLSDRLIHKLHQGTLDLVLMAFPYDTDGIAQMFLFEEPFYLACPKGHEPRENPLKTSDLQAGDLLLLEDGHCLRDHALAACGLGKAPQSKAYSATSLQTLIQMVNNGYGMTLLPDMAASATTIPKNISVIHFAQPVPTRQIGLAWRRGHPRRTEFETLGKTIRRT